MTTPEEQAEARPAVPALPAMRGKAAMLFAAALAVYLSNGRHVGQVDGRAAPYMAMSLLRQGNFDLDEFPGHCREGEAASPPYVFRVGGHFYSRWSPGAAIVYAPFFAIPAWCGMQPDLPDPDQPGSTKPNKAFVWVTKIAAAIVAALTAVVVLLILRRICRPPAATLLAILYAFGTVAWPINSQDTWQHGPGALLIAAGLLGAMRCARGGRRPGSAVGAAAALGMAVVVRETNAAMAAPLAVVLLARNPFRLWPAVISAGLLPVLGLMAYNHALFGVLIGGGYSAAFAASPWSTPLHVGAAGLLVSPSRGLLIYSPAMIFVPYGVWRGLRQKGDRLLVGMLAAGCLGHLALMSLWRGWFGGWSYGPRFLAEAMPAAVALLAFGADRIWQRIPRRVVLIGLTVISILIASLGCYVGVDDWHIRQEQVLGRPLGHAVWDWREWQILYQARKLLHLVGEPHVQPASAPGGD